MALIAYLMEFKGNYGPHLIIVPNAVLVNWKSELHRWIPNVDCIFYVGGKEERARLYTKVRTALAVGSRAGSTPHSDSLDNTRHL